MSGFAKRNIYIENAYQRNPLFISGFEKCKAMKKELTEELMPVEWHWK